MKIVRNLLSSLLMVLAFGIAMPSAVEAQPSPPQPPDLPAPPPLPAPLPLPAPPGRVVVHTDAGVRHHHRHHRRHHRRVRRHVVRHHVRRHHRRHHHNS
jgi:hypothetical protein